MQHEEHTTKQLPTIQDLERMLEKAGHVELAENMRKAEENYMEKRTQIQESKPSKWVVLKNTKERDTFFKQAIEKQYELLVQKGEIKD